MTMPSQADRGVQRIGVENSTENTVTLVLEPWATEYTIQPGEKRIIEADGPVAYGGFHVVYGADVITVWAWDGSDARILAADGTVIDDWTGNRVPDFIAPLPRSRS
jgi:hypothetical protein